MSTTETHIALYFDKNKGTVTVSRQWLPGHQRRSAAPKLTLAELKEIAPAVHALLGTEPGGLVTNTAEATTIFRRPDEQDRF